MARAFLIRGLLAGLVAGVVAFAVAYVVGEPSVEAAIALETAQTPAGADHGHASGTPDHTHDPSTAAVSRTLQSSLGLLTATAIAGTALGGVLAMMVALALGRVGGLGVRATTVAVAAIGFVACYAVPFLAYPPNPPAVGSSDTIGVRTSLYLVLVASSLIAASAAAVTGRWLTGRWGGWYATLTAGAGYLVAMIIVLALLPRFDEVPAGFPATLLVEFRTGSFLTQLALWTVLGVTLAELLHRLLQRSTAAAPKPSAATMLRRPSTR